MTRVKGERRDARRRTGEPELELAHTQERDEVNAELPGREYGAQEWEGGRAAEEWEEGQATARGTT